MTDKWHSSGAGTYWDQLWSLDSRRLGSGYVVLRVDKHYFVSPGFIAKRSDDIGPFNTLKDAKACCVVMTS